MPIYAYRCTNCGHQQDVLRKISDPLLTVCPSCGQATFAKQVTAAGFQLKGSGWYVTDFRNDAKGGKKDAEKKDGGDKEGGEAKPPGGETKPAGAETSAGDGAKSGDAPSPAPAPAASPAAAPTSAPAPSSSVKTPSSS